VLLPAGVHCLGSGPREEAYYSGSDSLYLQALQSSRVLVAMFLLAVIAALTLSLFTKDVNAVPAELTPRDICTIATYTDVSNVSGCTSITIAGQTVPAGESLALSDLKDGTTVTLSGDIVFATGVHWKGNLFSLTGGQIAFNGNGHTIDGNGAWYCQCPVYFGLQSLTTLIAGDGQGTNGGVDKPR
jgi:polygalacturonase